MTDMPLTAPVALDGTDLEIHRRAVMRFAFCRQCAFELENFWGDDIDTAELRAALDDEFSKLKARKAELDLAGFNTRQHWPPTVGRPQ